jgi:uncharacterized protein (DUF952 family)
VLIYKILLPAEWAKFEAAGRFDGSRFDRSSGFVHCSSREQVSGMRGESVRTPPRAALKATGPL